MRSITGTREVKLIAMRKVRPVQEVEEGVVLHGRASDKLSWEDTGRAMAAEREDWTDLEVTVADGPD